MSKKIRHVLGISGGKDSAALAMYLTAKYPEIDFEYYFADTGKELKETMELVNKLESILGKKIERLSAAPDSHKNAFDHYLDKYNGFLPSTLARWCTKNLKLEPFERWIGDDYAISYVAIRGDENREGYISTKPNIQTIFPFRKNIWSADVLNRFLHNSNINNLAALYKDIATELKLERANEIIQTEQSKKYTYTQKLNDLMNLDVKLFNKAVFSFMKQSTDYPLNHAEEFALVENEDVIDLEGVYKLFEENGVEIPKYYEKVEFEIDGEKGYYNRSRSGCYFCFYQQKIEWIWLLENHPDLFKLAKQYEKDGYSWMENERLEDLENPERIAQIKRDQLEKIRNKLNNKRSNKLTDILEDEDSNMCANCFI